VIVIPASILQKKKGLSALVLYIPSLHLLSSYFSSQWHELVHILLAHPKVTHVCFSWDHSSIVFVVFSSSLEHFATPFLFKAKLTLASQIALLSL
jgi:hypothetical protein